MSVIGLLLYGLHAFLLFEITVGAVTVQMEQAAVSVNEIVGTVNVCAEIAALPVDGLQTDLIVTLSTSDGSKAGL